MKRNALIITGSILVVILLAIWIYILFFNTTQPADKFTDLNIGNNPEQTSQPETSASSTNPTLDVTSEKQLVQLTNKPTAGYKEILTGSSSPKVFYVESGTGHIYSIDLLTGVEKQLTITTISFAKQAEITENGLFTMIQSGNNKKQTLIGTIINNNTELSTEIIDEEVVSFKATTNNTFLYAAKNSNQLVGKEYFPVTKTSKTLFTVPFLEATIDWGKVSADTHYIYPKASSKLEGYVYKVEKGTLIRTPISGFGLSAVGNKQYILYSNQNKESYKTTVYNSEQKLFTSSPVTIIPEKCTESQTDTKILVCGSEFTNFNDSIPDSWYQGVTSYADTLWQVDLDSLNIKSLASVSDQSGREIDTVNLSLNEAEDRVYFINKNDRTLWLYKRLTVNWE